MGQARHPGGEVQLVRIVFKGPDTNHLPVHLQVVFGVVPVLGSTHVFVPRKGPGPGGPGKLGKSVPVRDREFLCREQADDFDTRVGHDHFFFDTGSRIAVGGRAVGFQ